MSRTPGRATLASVLLIALATALLTGCGGGGASEGHDAQTSTPETSGPHDETLRDDLRSRHVVPWDRYETVAPDRLRLFVTTGDPRCYGLTLAMRETATTVEVATIVGTLPDAPSVCTQVARFASVLVTLRTPLGSRTVTHWDDPPTGTVST